MTTGENKVLLLLEDEHDMRSNLVRSFRRHLPNLRVIDAATREELDAKIEDDPEVESRVEIIVSDQVRNENTENHDREWGIHFLMDASERFPSAVRILLSAHTSGMDLARNLLENRLLHHFEPKQNDKQQVAETLVKKVGEVLKGNYKVLNINSEDLDFRDMLREAIRRFPKGEKMLFFAGEDEVEASEIERSPALLRKLKDSFLRGTMLGKSVRASAAVKP